MKIAILIAATLLSACTTVRVYDGNGTLLGSCRVSGITKKGGSCVGYANGQPQGGR